MSNLTASEFTTIVRQIGLNPDDHELDELRAAYLRLQELFVRLELSADAPDAESASVFNPLRPL